MEENNKTPVPQPEPSELPEKKLSRTTLTFYIIGLCAVAIALILISYVAQSRADKQLDTLADQLSEQQSVAQGITQKMEDLQKQLDDLTQQDEAVRQTLGLDATQSVAEAVAALREREQVLELLVNAEEAARTGDRAGLADLLDGFADAWGEEKLCLREQGGLFEEQDYAVYQRLLEVSQTTGE